MNEYIVQVDNQFSARVNNVARLPDFEATHIIYHMHQCTRSMQTPKQLHLQTQTYM